MDIRSVELTIYFLLGIQFKPAFVKKKYLLDKRHYERWLKKDKGKEDVPFKPITEGGLQCHQVWEGVVVSFLRCLRYDHKFAAELQQKWSEAVRSKEYCAYEPDDEDEKNDYS
ncbi:hypothetical protein H0H87_005163 [Tephrocybe sp. NHM501043]|nr:hypothetical protein H0H87_005163 [Tephrocybe sp. NHM501043]